MREMDRKQRYYQEARDMTGGNSDQRIEGFEAFWVKVEFTIVKLISIKNKIKRYCAIWV